MALSLPTSTMTTKGVTFGNDKNPADPIRVITIAVASTDGDYVKLVVDGKDKGLISIK